MVPDNPPILRKESSFKAQYSRMVHHEATRIRCTVKTSRSGMEATHMALWPGPLSGNPYRTAICRIRIHGPYF